MPDFTIRTYNALLDAITGKGYTFQTFTEFLTKPAARVVLLRHDVDARNQNSLEFASIQHSKNIVGSYYFRMVKGSYDQGIIREISSMGHEIGYHYENMDTCKGNIDKAYQEFRKNLDVLRKLCPVSTICMHGSPRSAYDNKAIWSMYDYRNDGILGEPYYDIDFNHVGYLTDTGRRWNGSSVSVRDKVESRYEFNFRTTDQIIANIHQLPDQMMFTFHPQRWTDQPFPWIVELLAQNAKNMIKKAVLNR
jgi:hypothetical protein